MIVSIRMVRKQLLWWGNKEQNRVRKEKQAIGTLNEHYTLN